MSNSLGIITRNVCLAVVVLKNNRAIYLPMDSGTWQVIESRQSTVASQIERRPSGPSHVSSPHFKSRSRNGDIIAGSGGKTSHSSKSSVSNSSPVLPHLGKVE